MASMLDLHGYFDKNRAGCQEDLIDVSPGNGEWRRLSTHAAIAIHALFIGYAILGANPKFYL